MGILTDQMTLSNATVNARKISVEEERFSNLALSQVRNGPDGNLLAGYYSGTIQGGDRSPNMYPNQNPIYVSVEFDESTGKEKINDAVKYSMKMENETTSDQASEDADYPGDNY